MAVENPLTGGGARAHVQQRNVFTRDRRGPVQGVVPTAAAATETSYLVVSARRVQKKSLRYTHAQCDVQSLYLFIYFFNNNNNC